MPTGSGLALAPPVAVASTALFSPGRGRLRCGGRRTDLVWGTAHIFWYVYHRAYPAIPLGPLGPFAVIRNLSLRNLLTLVACLIQLILQAVVGIDWIYLQFWQIISRSVQDCLVRSVHDGE